MSRDLKQKSDISFWSMLKSVLAAFFGVQGEANRQRDFSQGKPIEFIVIGLLAGLVFILLVWGMVKLVLYFSGVS